MRTFTLFRLAAAAILATALSTSAVAAEEKVLKIGVLGTMSGPAASWGLVNKYAAEATAQMYSWRPEDE